MTRIAYPRSLVFALFVSSLLAGAASATPPEAMIDHNIPAELRKKAEPDDLTYEKVGDFIRVRLLPAKPRPRLERLAEDAAKMARHCEKVKQRREANAKGVHVPPVVPRIVSMERLSTGLLMLAWEGDRDSLHGVASFDMEERRWQREAYDLLLHDGVVEWADTVRASSTYYYLWSADGFEVPEEESLKGEVTFRESGGVPVEAIIRVSFLDGRPADRASVTAWIDGEISGSIKPTEPGVYRMKLENQGLLPGRHFFSAELTNLSETTPEGDESGRFGGYFRTPTVPFELPEKLPHHFTGFRATTKDPQYQRTILVAELAPHYGEWSIEVHDSTGKKVRAWTGDTDREQGSSLSIQWNHRDDDGKPLPTGEYEARLMAEFEDQGQIRRECIGKQEINLY